MTWRLLAETCSGVGIAYVRQARPRAEPKRGPSFCEV